MKFWYHARMDHLRNQQHRVKVRDIGSSGEGIAAIGEFTIFVDGLLPGEEAIVRVTEVRKNFCRGELVHLLTPSKDRVSPICPVFGRCGGCQIMHLNYQAQLDWKRKGVVEALERIGKIQSPHVASTKRSPLPLYYRNKIQLPVALLEGRPVLGLYQKGSHRVIPISKCYIHNAIGEKCFEEISRIVSESSISVYDEEGHRGELRQVFLRTAVNKGGILVMLVTTRPPTKEIMRMANQIKQLDHVVSVVHGLNDRRDNVLLAHDTVLLEGSGVIYEEILGLTIQLSPQSFFQVNTAQAEAIYEKAYELSQVRPGERALDLFCGIGVFACYLAKKGIDVTGVELFPQAVEDAKENAKRNDVAISAFAQSAEEYMKKAPVFDVVFVNPPRKGCEESVIQQLIKLSPKKIVYTSCNPATLARDAQLLCHGGYKPVEFCPFDMFPQTVHVETVALFSK